MTVTTFLGLLAAPAALFVMIYFPAVTELSRTVASPYVKADIRKRLSAAATDALVVTTIWSVLPTLESFLVTGAMYVLLRDAVRGQSVGKLVFGLVVIQLDTGMPAGLKGSVLRNLLFLLPGANIPAIVLESITITRDVQGQRLGDRLALTMVVEGLGARDVVEAMQRWWIGFLGQLGRAGRPGRRAIRH